MGLAARFSRACLAVALSAGLCLTEARAEEARAIGVVPLAEGRPDVSGAQREQSFGVFVGVDRFEDSSITGLQYAAADARAMRDCFVEDLKLIPEGNARLLVTGAEGRDRPTRENVLEAIHATAQAAGKDGCVVVQLSTHGIENYVLAENSRRAILEDTAIPLSRIKEYLAGAGSPRRLLFFDACRETAGQKGTRALGGGMSEAFAKAFAQAEGFAVLMSCSEGQFSYEMPETGHGAFTHFVLEGLRGGAPAGTDGLVTVNTLAEWTRKQVESWSRAKSPGVQSPRFDLGQAKGDLPLALSKLHLQSEEQMRARVTQAAQKLAEMAAAGQLTLKQNGAAQSALASDDPKRQAVALELAEGKLTPQRFEEFLNLMDQARPPQPTPQPTAQPTPTATASPAKSTRTPKATAKPTVAPTPPLLPPGTTDKGAAELYDMGYKLFYGQGVAQDYAKAFQTFTRAAEMGHPEAMTMIGFYYDRGLGGVERNDAMAVVWYRRAAESGSASGMHDLGAMCRDGRGVQQDYTEAVRWFRLAVDRGYAVAMTALGMMYRDGKGVGQDAVEAGRWFRAASDLGERLGMNNLAFAYQTGVGVPQDLGEAVRLYRLAADQGEPLAMGNLGYLYETGLGMPQSRDQAVRWYQMAARLGEPVSQQNLKKLGESW